MTIGLIVSMGPWAMGPLVRAQGRGPIGPWAHGPRPIGSALGLSALAQPMVSAHGFGAMGPKWEKMPHMESQKVTKTTEKLTTCKKRVELIRES